MTALVSIADDETGTAYDKEKIAAPTEDAPDLNPEWVKVLNLWRLQHTTDQAFIPVKAAKVGRNERCTCGSGRK